MRNTEQSEQTWGIVRHIGSSLKEGDICHNQSKVLPEITE